jgi:hypothetical protein
MPTLITVAEIPGHFAATLITLSAIDVEITSLRDTSSPADCLVALLTTFVCNKTQQ